LPRILITNLSLCLIEEEPFQRKQRPDHVFADSLCLSFGLSSDFTVDVETWMLPAENLLYNGKADELFPKQQGEDLMGEDLADALIMEAGDMVEGAIWGCAGWKLMRSPKVWITATTPGMSSWPVTARKYFKRAWAAARDNGERRALL